MKLPSVSISVQPSNHNLSDVRAFFDANAKDRQSYALIFHTAARPRTAFDSDFSKMVNDRDEAHKNLVGAQTDLTNCNDDTCAASQGENDMTEEAARAIYDEGFQNYEQMSQLREDVVALFHGILNNPDCSQLGNKARLLMESSVQHMDGGIAQEKSTIEAASAVGHRCQVLARKQQLKVGIEATLAKYKGEYSELDEQFIIAAAMGELFEWLAKVKPLARLSAADLCKFWGIENEQDVEFMFGTERPTLSSCAWTRILELKLALFGRRVL